MKKIVRLTESDLARIVRRIISEQVPPGVNPTLKPNLDTKDALNGTDWKNLESELRKLGFKGSAKRIPAEKETFSRNVSKYVFGYDLQKEFWHIEMIGPKNIKIKYPHWMPDYDTTYYPNYVYIYDLPSKTKTGQKPFIPKSCEPNESDLSWDGDHGSLKVGCKTAILQLIKQYI